MTDFYSFINSKDIEKHLREINYEFTSLEAAWLVYQSRNTTLRQKISAWEDILYSRPDCEVPDRPNCIYRESLHDTLRKYIDLLESNLKVFKNDNNNSVYRYAIHWENRHRWDWDDDIYSSEKACRVEISKDIEDIRGFKIERIVPDKKNIKIVVYYNSEEQVTNIDPITDTDEAEDLDSFFFDGLWFQFPVPFEKGDIVVSSNNLSIYDGEPFVIDGCTAWDKYTKEHIANNGDYTDMNGRGYFQNEDGTVYYECMCNYMDLEYYRGSLDSVRRFLIALSNYEKNKIDVGLLLMAYHKITFDYAANPVMLYNWYTKEGLKLAGLEDVIKNME